MSRDGNVREQRNILLSGVQRLFELGGSRLIVSSKELIVVDQFQVSHTVLRSRDNHPINVPRIRKLIHEGAIHGNPSYRTDDDLLFCMDSHFYDTSSLGRFNEWVLLRDHPLHKTLIIEPRVRQPSALNDVFNVDAFNLNRLRSLYARGGLIIGVTCQDQADADAVIVALSSERHQLGLNTKITFLNEGLKERRRKKGILFKPIKTCQTVEADLWHIVECRNDQFIKLVDPHLIDRSNTDDTTHVYVSTYSGKNAKFANGRTLKKHIRENKGLPLLMITVRTTDNKPDADFSFSAGIYAMSSPAHFPWVTLKGQTPTSTQTLNNYSKSVEVFPTVESAAAGYISRQFARGWTSASDLYFHGPIAYSISDTNPIACILEVPDWNPVLLVGRTRNAGGRFGSRVTKAWREIINAAENEFTIFHIQDLTAFIRFGGAHLANVPQYFRRGGDETEFPKTVSLHKVALENWITSEFETRWESIHSNSQPAFPTHVKANAYQALAALASFRDFVSASMKVHLLEIGDFEAYRYKASEERVAAQKHIEEMRDEIDEEDLDEEITPPLM